MNPLIQFCLAHQLALYILFCSIVSMLPTPIDGERWYKFAYDILHFFASNVAKVFPSLRIQRNGQQG